MNCNEHCNILEALEYEKILFALKNEASSLVGKDRAMLLRPAHDYSEAKDWLEQTTEACIVMETAFPPFGGIHDIRQSLKKSQLGSILEAKDFIDILDTMYAMRSLKKFFKELEADVTVLKEWAQGIEILGQLEKTIGCTFDENGNLRDNASVELQRIRRGIKSAQSHVKKALDAILHSAENQKIFQDAIVTMRDNRYVIPVKQEYRAMFPGIVHAQSSTGATLFIEPLAVVELNNDIKQLELAETQEMERILRALSEKVKINAEVLSSNLQILAQLDFTFAKAKLAKSQKATLPDLVNNGITELHRARHPFIPLDKAVPIDICIGDKYSMLLVTGPNTGGKTVSMKTLGILALMAKSGLYITAQDASKIAFYKNIFADIGDEQSIEQSLSTFSAHMTHIIGLLAAAESGDLLLLDEIGAGTDPEEGAALAIAILEQLLNMRTYVVATTHYSELKVFAYTHKDVENACVEFDIKTLKPTYRLLIGIPGASNAFAISRRLGLDEAIVDRAGELIKADKVHFEDIINKLEGEKITYEKRNADIVERQKNVVKLEAKLETIKDELLQKKAAIIRKAREDSAALVRKTRWESEAVIKELKAQFDDQGTKRRQQVIQESRDKLKSVSEKVRPEFIADQSYRVPVNPDTIETGDTVFVQTINQKAVVVAIKGKDLVVQLGSMKMTVRLNKCRFVAKRTKEENTDTKQAAISLQKVTAAHRELDIRGVMVDEGEQLTEKFLDNAALAGLKEVLIIHGKGTGALRKGIHEYLKRNKNVIDFNFADIDEGGTGATLVSLK